MLTALSRRELAGALDAAVSEARARAAGDARWLSAISAAWHWLAEQDVLAYDPAHHELHVPSATTAGKVYVAGTACQCKAYAAGRQACWHRAAARLVRRALEHYGERVLEELFSPR